MCGVCARRTRTARVGRGPSPRVRERRTDHYRRRDKTGTRERGIRSVGRRRRYRRSPPHTHARAPSNTRASGCTLGRQALAHYRLPDSHHELLEKSIEYKKSPWCARRAEPSPLLSSLRPRHFPPALSRPRSRSFPFPLSFSPSLSSSVLPPFRPHCTLPASLSPHLSRAQHTRYLCSPLLRDKERESSRVYTGDRRR